MGNEESFLIFLSDKHKVISSQTLMQIATKTK